MDGQNKYSSKALPTTSCTVQFIAQFDHSENYIKKMESDHMGKIGDAEKR